MRGPLAAQWDSTADQGGWARPGTLFLLLVTTIVYFGWSMVSTIAAGVWFTIRPEQDDTSWTPRNMP